MSFFSMEVMPLKQSEIEKIIHGMLHVARPLEIACVRNLISDGTVNEVIFELEKYQNQDGGFGHGLEPDCWNPFSSGLETCAACQIIRNHQIDEMTDLVQKMMSYLDLSFDDFIMRWHATDPNTNDYPHAPWWEHMDDKKSFNPSASLAGFVIRYGNPMTPIYTKSKKVIDEALHYILNNNHVIERHELRALIEMMNDIQWLYKDKKSYKNAKNIMILRIEDSIEKDESLWFTTYANKPSSLIKSHPSLGSNVFFDRLIKEIGMSFLYQNSENLWDITWQWNGYPEAFMKAKKDWQGILAYEYIKLIIDLGIIIES